MNDFKYNIFYIILPIHIISDIENIYPEKRSRNQPKVINTH